MAVLATIIYYAHKIRIHSTYQNTDRGEHGEDYAGATPAHGGEPIAERAAAPLPRLRLWGTTLGVRIDFSNCHWRTLPIPVRHAATQTASSSLDAEALTRITQQPVPLRRAISCEGVVARMRLFPSDYRPLR